MALEGAAAEMVVEEEVPDLGPEAAVMVDGLLLDGDLAELQEGGYVEEVPAEALRTFGGFLRWRALGGARPAWPGPPHTQTWAATPLGRRWNARESRLFREARARASGEPRAEGVAPADTVDPAPAGGSAQPAAES